MPRSILFILLAAATLAWGACGGKGAQCDAFIKTANDLGGQARAMGLNKPEDARKLVEVIRRAIGRLDATDISDQQLEDYAARYRSILTSMAALSEELAGAAERHERETVQAKAQAMRDLAVREKTLAGQVNGYCRQ